MILGSGVSAMKRREFITLLGCAAVARPLAAQAQGERVRRIGVLMALTADDPSVIASTAKDAAVALRGFSQYSIPAGCHRGRRHGGNSSCENRYANHPDRHGDELRSGWNWFGREPQSAWRQRNRAESPDGGTERQAATTPDRNCCWTRTGSRFVESVKSEYRPDCGANENGSASAWY